MSLDEALHCILNGAHYAIHQVDGSAYCTSYERCPFQSKDSSYFDNYGTIEEGREIFGCLFRERMEEIYQQLRRKNGN